MRSLITARVVRSALLLLLYIGCCRLAEAQISARAGIFLKATLPGNVSLSTRSIPISILVKSGQSSSAETSFPLTVTWNLDPREVRGFEVVSYFANPHSALVNNTANEAIPAERVLGRWGNEAFRPFNEASAIGPAGNSLRLLGRSISPGDSRGSRDDMLSVSIDPAVAATIREGKYTGVLYVEFRYY